jgi:hypothetical protein
MSPRTDDDIPARARELPQWLWKQLKADPTRAPEHLALAAHQVHGPAAQRWVDSRRARDAHVSNEELAQIAKHQHIHLARAAGAATGLGGYWTVVPDLAALAGIQARLVFCVAAAYGFDPTDRMRPAELLVLMEMFENPHAARDALDGVGSRAAVALVTSRVKGGGDKTLMGRLAMMAGKRTGKRLGGRLVPVLAIAVNSMGNAADTRALADRAVRFYGG